MKRLRIIISLFLLPGILMAEELINDIVAIVGETPITALDLQQEKKNFKPSKKENRNTDSQVLDSLINRALIDSVLKEEVISIPESQVDEIIKNTMLDNGIKDEKAFEAALMQQANMTLKEYREQLLNNLKMQQIAQLKISIPTPRESEVQAWYNQHRNEIGNKYNIRILTKAFNPDNPKEELSVSKLMASAREEAVQNFPAAVAKYSDDTANGGSLGWIRIDELMSKDPMMANIVYRLNAGETSMVFVSGRKYMLVKVEAIAPISLEDATPLIMQRLYREKQAGAYESWLAEKRRTSAIKIFLKSYQQ